MTSYELCSITAVSDSFFFFVLSLFCGARHINNNNNNTESLHSIHWCLQPLTLIA